MANYVVDPTDPTQPTNSRGAKQGAEEFRALKGLVQTLFGGSAVAPVNLFRKNAIIGGDFDTNPWQRGVNFVAIGNNVYGADRFKYLKTGTFVEDLTRIVEAPTLGTVYKNKTMDIFAINSLQTNVTTAEAALGVNEYSYINHFIEGYNWKQLAQLPFVLSFWHKHTKIGTYCVGFLNGGLDRDYVAEYQQTVSNTWEFEQIAVPAPPSAGTWNYTNGIGLEIAFTKGIGSALFVAPNIWQNNGYGRGTANQVNSLDTIGNKFQIALVQLETGTIASKFERRTFQEELALCQRYYEKTFQEGTTPAQNVGTFYLSVRSGVTGIANSATLRWNFCVPKRGAAASTITTYNPGAANANWRDITAAVDRVVAVDSINQTGVSITVSSVAIAGNINGIHATADAEF